MKIESKDGTVIAFDQIGEGSPIILVAGASCDRAIDTRSPRLWHEALRSSTTTDGVAATVPIHRHILSRGKSRTSMRSWRPPVDPPACWACPPGPC
jgi:hypothetical protein